MFIPSLYVQTTVVDAVIGKIVAVVPVMVPEQLSVAVGGVILEIWHCAVSVGNEDKLGTGAVASAIVIIWF